MASTGDLLRLEPQELQFPFELRKHISCSLQLSSKTDNYVAFKVKTTNPKKYCVKPNTGIVSPWATCNVMVTMQAQKEVPADMQCKDKFLVQSVVAAPGATAKDISTDMFNKESGHNVEECKLRVVYLPPPRRVSPVREGSDEGSSPRASFSDNGHTAVSELTAAARPYVDSQDNSFEMRALMSKLTDERNSATRLHKHLQQELEVLRRQTSSRTSSTGNIPVMYVVLVGMIGIFLGYLMKRLRKKREEGNFDSSYALVSQHTVQKPFMSIDVRLARVSTHHTQTGYEKGFVKDKTLLRPGVLGPLVFSKERRRTRYGK
ncbi:hypothetical protein MLD38_023815 [Melastoma candidum]|uniref:Uncharacterized protein n=1 Tax=Melastoma candidum TaxID=119954 RepID=A0ACB9NQ97_9MYRT|nr:hypothetical protein MLD38_023815 [Melastoma candidum]